jgi:hypothetical protein
LSNAPVKTDRRATVVACLLSLAVFHLYLVPIGVPYLRSTDGGLALGILLPGGLTLLGGIFTRTGLIIWFSPESVTLYTPNDPEHPERGGHSRPATKKTAMRYLGFALICFLLPFLPSL